MNGNLSRCLLGVASVITGFPAMALEAHLRREVSDASCARCNHYHLADRYSEPECQRRQQYGKCKHHRYWVCAD
jgi:hypothetical protein